MPMPSVLEANATTINVCVGSAEPENKKPQCFAVDRAKGTYAAWTPPTPPAPAATGRAKLTVEANALKVCDPSGAKCSTVKPKGFEGNDSTEAATNDAGTYVAVTMPDAKRSAVEVYDVATGKRTARIPLVGAESGCGSGTLLDDVVLVVDDNCGGPDGDGTLYTVKGKKLKLLGGKGDDRLNAYGPEPVHLDGSTWAIGLPMEGVVLWVDTKTGKELKRVSLEKMNGEAHEGGPPTLLVKKTDDGKLLVASGAASVGVIDIASAALEVAWTAKPCPETP
jgi:hypothetical protein